jgi:AcrR family transcriptional regulator
MLPAPSVMAQTRRIMAGREGREHEQRRQQIMNGALQAFAQYGFDRATNRDIAQAAQIASPGLIYHYFKGKEDLLLQLIRERMPQLWMIEQGDDSGDQPPGVALPQLALEVARQLQDESYVAILKVVLVEAIRSPKVAQMINEVGPGYALQVLVGYLERQMAAGRLRRMNPQIAARLLIGPLIAHGLMHSVFEQDASFALAPEEIAQAAVDSFLRELAP